MSMKIKRGTIPEIRPKAPVGPQRDKKLREMLLSRAGWGVGRTLPPSCATCRRHQAGSPERLTLLQHFIITCKLPRKEKEIIKAKKHHSITQTSSPAENQTKRLIQVSL